MSRRSVTSGEVPDKSCRSGLAELRDQGILTDEEFAAQKAEVLA